MSQRASMPMNQPSAPPLPSSPEADDSIGSREWLQPNSNGGGHVSKKGVDPFCIPDFGDSGVSKPPIESLEKKDRSGRSADGFIEGLDIKDELDWTTKILTVLSLIIVFLTFPISMFFCVKIVAEYERAVVLRMGRLLPKGMGTKGPGVFFILPCLDTFRKVELRTVTFDIPPQEVLTKDSVTVAVDAVVYYRICNPAVSVLNVEDAARSTRLLAQTTLRNVLGTKDLAQILMDREEMSQTMQTTIDQATEAWGVKVS
ncbi:hypothetical protein Ciccas_007068 [Cichlidogyrus casuarinus]|uniref:Band 7 domain-containing protein n=1 Tax=Cichlidogyrus casuarinus TaxID=1844966 RepID=A0ABD2Q7W1_9PLAT